MGIFGHKSPEALTPEQELEKNWHDPLAIEVGLGVGADDLPAYGWPKEFKPEVVKRILSYLPEE